MAAIASGECSSAAAPVVHLATMAQMEPSLRGGGRGDSEARWGAGSVPRWSLRRSPSPSSCFPAARAHTQLLRLLSADTGFAGAAPDLQRAADSSADAGRPRNDGRGALEASPRFPASRLWAARPDWRRSPPSAAPRSRSKRSPDSPIDRPVRVLHCRVPGVLQGARHGVVAGREFAAGDGAAAPWSSSCRRRSPAASSRGGVPRPPPAAGESRLLRRLADDCRGRARRAVSGSGRWAPSRSCTRRSRRHRFPGCTCTSGRRAIRCWWAPCVPR